MKKFLNLNIQLFASNSASKTIYAPASNTYGYNLSVSWLEKKTADSDSQNTTTVNIVGSLLGSKINFSQSANNTLAVYWFDDNQYKNGKLVASKNITSTSKNVTDSVDGTITVTHKSDGSLNGYARAIFTKSGSNSFVPPTSNIDTANTVLITIPRATNCPAETLIVGKTNVINLSPASDSFYHKMTFAIGNTTFTSTSGKESLNFDLTATSIYNLFATKSVQAEATLTTYSDSTLSKVIGTSKNTIAIAVNEDVVRPTITATYKDTNSSIVAITGSNQTIVKNKSTLEIQMNATTHYATIKNYIVNGIEQGSTSKFTTSSPISNQYTYEVEDSRGIFSQKKTLNIAKFIDYINPIADVKFTRNGPTTGKVKVKYSGQWFNGAIGNTTNTLTVKYQYKKRNETNWSTAISLSPTKNGNTFNGEVELSGTFDYQSAYDFQLIVTDKLGSNSFSDVVPRGKSDWWGNGKKIGFNVPIYFKSGNEILDYDNTTDDNSLKFKNNNNEYVYPHPYYPVGFIYTSVKDINPSELYDGKWEEIICSELIASGNSDGVNYRVYSDGFVEYFGYIETGNIGPYGSAWLRINYPFPVIFGETYCQVSRKVGGNYWSFVEFAIDNSSSAHATIPVYNNSSVGTADSLTLYYRIISKIDLNAQKDTFKNIPKKWRRIS